MAGVPVFEPSCSTLRRSGLVPFEARMNWIQVDCSLPWDPGLWDMCAPTRSHLGNSSVVPRTVCFSTVTMSGQHSPPWPA